MAERRMGIIAALLCFCLCFTPVTAFAAKTSDAKEPINTKNECSLEVFYRHEISVFSGHEIKLYKVADVSETAEYSLVPALKKTGLVINGIQTNGEWKTIRSTLEIYVLLGALKPLKTAVTDENGRVNFTGLEPGLYLVSGLNDSRNGWTYIFDSALVALPGLDENGYWKYDVTVNSKSEVLPPTDSDEEIELKVLKLWKGDEKKINRPSSIEVEIFRDGKLFETVELSEKNNWSYSWKVKNDGAKWAAIERNVPKGYSMTLEIRERAFVITNTVIPENPDVPPVVPPDTGDTSNILLYTALMFVSGAMLLIFGITEKRNRHEEN